ncbi:hypothetical protein QVA66_10940 [Staphylococcus chromogenes]|nr:hypothetical protein [Staphylococcus chromogenes]
MIPICSSNDTKDIAAVNKQHWHGLVTRMLELVSRNTTWHRKNWRASTLELVSDVIEESQIAGTKERALRELREYLATALKGDPGIRQDQLAILGVVGKIDPTSSDASNRVCLARQYLQDMQESYLDNWIEYLRNPSSFQDDEDIEGAAKKIIAHLTYGRLSEESIYATLRASELDSGPGEAFLEKLQVLQRKLHSAKREFTFVVPLDKAPSFLFNKDLPKGWLTAAQVKEWKNKYAKVAPTPRHHVVLS